MTGLLYNLLAYSEGLAGPRCSLAAPPGGVSAAVAEMRGERVHHIPVDWRMGGEIPDAPDSNHTIEHV
jgi:hypothetical protein